MKISAMILSVSLAAVISCGGNDPVPSSPDNPANPNAPQGQVLSGTEPLTGESDGMKHDGMKHNSMKHDGMKHDGMKHDGMKHDGMKHDGMKHDGKGSEGATTPDALLAAEMTAYEAAKPIFAGYCVACHTTAGTGTSASKKAARKHLTMDSYPFGGHHTAEVGKTILKSIGATDAKATMPKGNPGSLSAQERTVIETWAAAFEKAHATGAGHHKSHSHAH